MASPHRRRPAPKRIALATMAGVAGWAAVKNRSGLRSIGDTLGLCAYLMAVNGRPPEPTLLARSYRASRAARPLPLSAPLAPNALVAIDSSASIESHATEERVPERPAV